MKKIYFITLAAITIIYSFRVIINNSEFYAFDIIRPIIYIVFGFMLFSKANINQFKLIETYSTKIFLFLFTFQFIFIILQVLMIQSPIVMKISSLLNSQLVVQTTWLEYYRAIGLFGGPAGSGVFCIAGLLIGRYLYQASKLNRVNYRIISIIALLSTIGMQSKGAFFVIFITFIFDFILPPRKFNEQSYPPKRFLLANAIGSLIIGTITFSFFFLIDVYKVRSLGIVFSYIANLFRKSSLFGRLDMHIENILFSGGPIQLLTGTSDTITDKITNRVYDSDFLYFTNVFGLFGLLFFIALSLILIKVLHRAGMPITISGLYVVASILNPLFTATFSSFPILTIIYIYYKKDKVTKLQLNRSVYSS